MNYRDAEMLQGSIQNLGNTFGRQRQLDVENDFRRQQMEEARKRTQLDDNFRQQQIEHYKNMEAENARRADEAARRADAQDKRTDLANQPKIQADLIDPDTNSAMTFTGTPEQLDGIVAGAAQKGKKITVGNRRAFAAQFSVGGAQFSFSDSATAKTFAEQMKAQHGIDVFDAKFGKGGTQKQTTYERNLAVYQAELEAAQEADTPEEQQMHMEKANMTKAYLSKAGQFAPPKPVVPMTKQTILQDKPEIPNGAPTFRTNTVTTQPMTANAAPMTAPAKTKAEVANALAKEHPDWSREKIISTVNQQFTK